MSLSDELSTGAPFPAFDSVSDRVAILTSIDAQQQAALAKIEHVFECIVDSLANNDKQLIIVLKRKDNSALLRHPVTSPCPSASVIAKQICFPGRTPQDAWRFS